MEWKDLTKEEKIQKIEEILDQEIRPILRADGGDIKVVKLLNENEVVIAYKGVCMGCPSAKTSTLAMIQDVLRRKLNEEIVVIPEF